MSYPLVKPDESKLARRDFIEFMFSQIVEKLLRMKSFLNETQREVQGARVNLLKSFDSFLEQQWDELGKRIDLFAKLSGGEKARAEGRFVLEEKDQHVFFLYLKAQAERIKDRHSALRWVATPWVELETYTFLEGLFQEPRSRKAYEEINGTVVFTNEYRFETYEPYLGAGGARTPVLGLPKIERSNPLMWSVLVHEVCHQICDRYSIGANVYNRLKGMVTLDEAKLLQDWANEFAADLLSLKLLGPAYVFSMISYAAVFRRESLHRPSATHPSTSGRVEALQKNVAAGGMYEYSTDVGSPGGFLIIYGTRLLFDREAGQMYFQEPRDPALSPEVVDALVQEVEFQFREQSVPVTEFSNENWKKSLQMAKSLKGRMLISSSLAPDAEEDARRLIAREMTPEAFERVCSLLNESPNLTSEIVNAGWIAKAERQRGAMKELICGGGPFVERLRAYEENDEYVDSLLQKSIETAVIHRFYSQGTGQRGALS